MINEQFSLLQMVLAMLSSSVLSSGITFFSTKRQNHATADETIRRTYGEMMKDLRDQLNFVNEQLKLAQEREMNHLSIIAQQNGTVSSIQAELSASQLNIRNLENQKHKLESKISNYENLFKRQETYSKA